MTLEERLLSRTLKTETCWIWQGSKAKQGYGQMRYQNRLSQTHRLSYMVHKGSPEGWCVLHKCDNPPCLNPDHLFLGTNADNVADKIAKGRQHRMSEIRTHCRSGHEYTEKNTRVITHPNGSLVRRCRTCHNKTTLASYHRRKAQ